MLKTLPIYLLLLLISACANQHQKAETLPLTTSDKVALQMEAHWTLSYFDEPVFNSKVAVLEAGNKNNPPIILIHGLGQLAMKDWFSVIPTLEKNYHVIAIDLPGFGLSASSKGRFLPTNYAHVIASISKEYINGKAIVIGHSMGGTVALRYTELYENLVKQLILVDAAGILEKSTFIKHITFIEYDDDVPMIMGALIDGANGFSSSMIEVGTKSTFISDFLYGNKYTWDWLVSDSSNMNAALSLVEEDFNQAVHQVDVPVDIIWGEKDNVAPLRTGKVLNKQMSNSRLQIINGAGHVPMKSHHTEFINVLNTALKDPIKDKYTLSTTGESQGILTCRGQRDKTYSGHYDEILIEGCDNLVLRNISTGRLRIKSSVVDIEDFSFSHEDNQIEFIGAVVSITNADISGHNTMLINGSRVDMAGVSFKAKGDAVMIGNGSRISISLCDINSPKHTGMLHGAFYLSRQLLIE